MLALGEGHLCGHFLTCGNCYSLQGSNILACAVNILLWSNLPGLADPTG